MFTWTGSKGIKYLPLCLYPCRSVNSPITNPIGSDSILCMNTSQVIYCSLNSSITFFSFTVLILKANLLLIKISCWQWLNVHTERLLFTFFSVHSQIQAPKLNKKVFQDLWGGRDRNRVRKKYRVGGYEDAHSIKMWPFANFRVSIVNDTVISFIYPLSPLYLINRHKKTYNIQELGRGCLS